MLSDNKCFFVFFLDKRIMTSSKTQKGGCLFYFIDCSSMFNFNTILKWHKQKW